MSDRRLKSSRTIRQRIFKQLTWPSELRTEDLEEVRQAWLRLMPDIRLGKNALPLAEKSQVPWDASLEALMDKIGAAPDFKILTNDVRLGGNDWFEGCHDDPLWRFEMAVGAIRDEVRVRTNVRFTREEISKLITRWALENPFHPVEEWILSQEPYNPKEEPDYIAQLAQHITPGGLVIPDQCTLDPLVLFLTKWLIQCVQAARGWRQPISLPYVLTFVGDQGQGKGEFFRSIVPFPEWVGEGHLRLGTRKEEDDIRRANSFWIFEMPEVEAQYKAADKEATKAYISRTKDTLRLPYDRGMSTLPRTVSHCASANSMQPLRDDTGDRRWLPISVQNINPDHGIDPARLWAQVNALWEAHNTCYFLDANLGKTEIGPEKTLQAFVCEQFRETTQLEDDVDHVLHAWEQGVDPRPPGFYEPGPKATKKTEHYVLSASLLIEATNQVRLTDHKRNQREKRIVGAMLRRRFGPPEQHRAGKKVVDGWVIEGVWPGDDAAIPKLSPQQIADRKWLK